MKNINLEYFAVKYIKLQDLYQVLVENATIDECIKAFRKLALDLHPDRNYNDKSEERSRKLLLFKKFSDTMDKIK